MAVNLAVKIAEVLLLTRRWSRSGACCCLVVFGLRRRIFFTVFSGCQTYSAGQCGGSQAGVRGNWTKVGLYFVLRVIR